MCWTHFKTIGHSSKNLGPSQKTLRPSWCPKLVTGLRTHFGLSNGQTVKLVIQSELLAQLWLWCCSHGLQNGWSTITRMPRFHTMFIYLRAPEQFKVLQRENKCTNNSVSAPQTLPTLQYDHTPKTNRQSSRMDKATSSGGVIYDW